MNMFVRGCDQMPRPSEDQLMSNHFNTTDYHRARLKEGWVTSPQGDWDQETIDWLVREVGLMVNRADRRAIQGNGDWDLVNDDIMFRDPQKAVLFKLIWGGS